MTDDSISSHSGLDPFQAVDSHSHGLSFVEGGQSVDNDGGSSTSEVTNSEVARNDADAATRRKQLSKHHWSQDNQQVTLWMSLVLLMIAVTASIVIVLVLSFIRADQEEQFKNGFEQQALVIEEAVLYHTKTVVASLENLALSVTSYAVDSDSEWPFVTMPYFEKETEYVLDEADMEFVGFSPIVHPEDKMRWASYSSNESSWMAAATGFDGEIYQVDSDTGIIMDTDGSYQQSEEDSLPLWMLSPRPYDTSLVNYDLLSDPLFAKLWHSVVDDPHSKFSDAFTDSDYIQLKGYAPGAHDNFHDHHAGHGIQDSSGSADSHDHFRRRDRHLQQKHQPQQGQEDIDGLILLPKTNMRRRRLQEIINAPAGVEDDDILMPGHDIDDDTISETDMHHPEIQTDMGAVDTMIEASNHTHTEMMNHSQSLMTDTDVTHADSHHATEQEDHSSHHGMEAPRSEDIQHANDHVTEEHSSNTSTPEDDHATGEHLSHSTDIDHDDDSSVSSSNNSSGHRMSVGSDSIPHAVLITPVWNNFDKTAVAGVVFGIIPWDFYVTDLLPEGVDNIVCVVQSTCGQSFTFLIDGPHAEFLVKGDTHDPKFENMAVHIELEKGFGGDSSDSEDNFYADDDKDEYCHFSLTVYPSEAFESAYKSNDDSIKFITLLVCIFATLALFFFIFLWFVQRRQNKVVKLATRTTAIVSNLFPEAVRNRILKQAAEEAAKDDSSSANNSGGKASRAMKSILQEVKGGAGIRKASAGKNNNTAISILKDAPIADLYPDCTVGFFDLVGFTAWSSTRQPHEVFVLLETLYGEFDSIARRRRVFKVETIGDCYVAVCGLPVPRRGHALVMSRFARNCLEKSIEVFHHLEVTLGPGTSALNLRLGLHSGPVTAGVLRGEKGRFQLFGDTVNTAARMESNSAAGKIHCSKETADLLLAAGKSHWLIERPDRIVAKGKGSLLTFWIDTETGDNKSIRSTLSDLSSCGLDKPDLLEDIAEIALNPCDDNLSDAHLRLVDWNVELLSKLLKNIIASRSKTSRSKRRNEIPFFQPKLGETPFDEWAQAIDLPKSSKENADGSDIELSPSVTMQLRLFVFNIACLHGQNPFHNFDHSSHVTLSTHKLLTRVIQSGDGSYRVASDPMVHFSATLAALIHDVDHRGIPNERLIVENPALAKTYAGKSVAEQHAIDLSWKLLMKDDFKELRQTIYTTQAELQHFRTVLVNSVLSTDIVNKDLKTLRNERWTKAFSEGHGSDADRYRASCVLEHLIQASDVSHTMQHWQIYRSWNEKLFKEMLLAYKEGRTSTDPSHNWYQGELGFFDFYIIPLAKKLAEVGVFGVSSSEYLDFAQKNRDEWATKGKSIVTQMLLEANATDGKNSEDDDEGGIGILERGLEELQSELATMSAMFEFQRTDSGREFIDC